MKFAETPIQKNQFIYLKDLIMENLKAQVGDVLEWHGEDGKVIVVKKQ